mmetsp:Transcript_7656/g.28675  ORF Transcript_7656/g.28675 Transcript_7656/m.28675 type:complete len:1958 (-) Transcript_7656:1086-6959(-)|eukprot:CAMPEP_0117435812 /NCGR_PEP_ID=MMETSP0759-20121206/678_1 /TAXON_ID=63605 /ORGANISM="Percolomonas cosmopolitus, Strain WS" /LENGTH=1957 /DNA_ID=CAMNT_0005227379 /DNA_START=294 /DNA_END=6167 /DNA_ORIENTATION=+
MTEQSRSESYKVNVRQRDNDDSEESVGIGTCGNVAIPDKDPGSDAQKQEDSHFHVVREEQIGDEPKEDGSNALNESEQQSAPKNSQTRRQSVHNKKRPGFRDGFRRVNRLLFRGTMEDIDDEERDTQKQLQRLLKLKMDSSSSTATTIKGFDQPQDASIETSSHPRPFASQSASLATEEKKRMRFVKFLGGTSHYETTASVLNYELLSQKVDRIVTSGFLSELDESPQQHGASGPLIDNALSQASLRWATVVKHSIETKNGASSEKSAVSKNNTTTAQKENRRQENPFLHLLHNLRLLFERFTALNTSTVTANGTSMSGKTFFLFSPEFLPRKILFRLLFSLPSSFFMYIIIAVNFFLQSFADTSKTVYFSSEMGSYNLFLFIFDKIVLGLLFVEMVLRMLALGLFSSKHSYFRATKFNWLDTFVLVLGIICVASHFPLNSSILLMFRLVKPLADIPGLSMFRSIVTTLNRSLRQLSHVLLFIMFWFLVFGVVGLEFFSRSYSRRCVLPTSVPVSSQIFTENIPTVPADTFCARDEYGGPFAVTQKSFGLICPSGQYCVGNQPLPLHGAANFDNALSTFVALFQIQTLTSWTELLYPLMQSEFRDFVPLYFIVVIFVLSFTVTNIMIATIVGVFSSVRAEEMDKKRKRTAKLIVKKLDASSSAHPSTNRTTDSEEPQSPLSPEQPLPFVAQFTTTVLNMWLSLKQMLEKNPLARSWRKFNFLRRSMQPRLWNMFDWIALFLMLVHLVLRSTVYAGMSDTHALALQIMDYIFLVAYTAEMLLRLVATESLFAYVFSFENALDWFLIFASYVGIILSLTISPRLSFQSYLFVRIVVRSLRAMMRWDWLPSIQKMAVNTVHSLPPVFNLLCFMFFCACIFSALSLQMFGNQLKSPDLTGALKSDTENYDNFFSAFVTLYKILLKDNWKATPYKIFSLDSKIRYASVPFFFVYFVLAVYINLNIFTAVVIGSFERDEENKKQQRVKRKQKTMRKRIFFLYRWHVVSSAFIRSALCICFQKKKGSGRARVYEQSVEAASDPSPNDEINLPHKSVPAQPTMLNPSEFTNLHSDPLDSIEVKMLHESDDKSLFCFSKRNPFRASAIKIVTSSIYGAFMMLVICLNVLQVSFEDQIEADQTLDHPKDFMYYLNLVAEILFLIIYSADFLIKCVAMGMLLTRKPYFSSIWNRIDAFALVVDLSAFIVQFALPSTSEVVRVVRILRIVRSVRLLRIIRRVASMRRILTALFKSLASICTTLAFCLCFFYVYGAVGVILFSGRYNYCTDATFTDESACVGYYTNPLGVLTKRSWRAYWYNFDNILNAIMTLFEVATFSNWSRVLFVAIDRAENVVHLLISTLYFVFFISIGVLIILNLFVGVIIDSIDMQTGVALLSSKQQDFVHFQKKISILLPMKKYLKPRKLIRRVLYIVGESKLYTYFIALVEFSNAVVLLLQHADQSTGMTIFQRIANIVFVILYCADFFIKIVAYGPKTFLGDFWMRYDSVMCVGAAISTVAQVLLWIVEIFNVNLPTNVVLVVNFLGRSFRVLLLFRLIRRIKGVRDMFETLLSGLPSITNAIAILFLLFFSFSIIGKQLLANVKFQSQLTPVCNFRHTWVGFVSLIRVVTMDSWNDLFRELTITSPYCTQTDGFSDCGGIGTYIYFAFFLITGSYVFVNLIISIILFVFSHFYVNINFPIEDADLRGFLKVFSLFDPYGSGFIRKYNFRTFMVALHDCKSKLSFDVDRNRMLIEAMAFQLDHLQHSVVPNDEDNNSLTHRVKNAIFRLTESGRRKNMYHYQDILLLLVKLSLDKEYFQDKEYEQHVLTLCTSYVNAAALIITRNIRRKAIVNRLKNKVIDIDPFEEVTDDEEETVVSTDGDVFASERKGEAISSDEDILNTTEDEKSSDSDEQEILNGVVTEVSVDAGGTSLPASIPHTPDEHLARETVPSKSSSTSILTSLDEKEPTDE